MGGGSGRVELASLRLRGDLVEAGPKLDGQKVGVWTVKQAGGHLFALVSYESGVKQGPFLEYHVNGQLATAGWHVGGSLNGNWRTWNDAGVLVESGMFVGGKEEGSWEYWRQDGTKCARGCYVQGVREGEWRGWYSDGSDEYVLEFKSGRMDGSCVFFEPSGSIDLAQSGRFLEGVRVEEYRPSK